MPYATAGGGSIEPLIEKLKTSAASDRWILRKLQRFTVTVRRKQVETWQVRGDVNELMPGLYLLVDRLRYDERLGLMPEGQPLDAATLVQ